jgi:hypothetical protein
MATRQSFQKYVSPTDTNQIRSWKIDVDNLPEFERHLLWWEYKYETKVLDRASDPSRVTAFANPEHWKLINNLPSQWLLASLAVSSKHQRRGIGMFQSSFLIYRYQFCYLDP